MVPTAFLSGARHYESGVRKLNIPSYQWTAESLPPVSLGRSYTNCVLMSFLVLNLNELCISHVLHLVHCLTSSVIHKIQCH